MEVGFRLGYVNVVVFFIGPNIILSFYEKKKKIKLNLDR
jgi:hypothetical protein